MQKFQLLSAFPGSWNDTLRAGVFSTLDIPSLAILSVVRSLSQVSTLFSLFRKILTGLILTKKCN